MFALNLYSKHAVWISVPFEVQMGIDENKASDKESKRTNNKDIKRKQPCELRKTKEKTFTRMSYIQFFAFSARFSPYAYVCASVCLFYCEHELIAKLHQTQKWIFRFATPYVYNRTHRNAAFYVYILPLKHLCLYACVCSTYATAFHVQCLSHYFAMEENEQNKNAISMNIPSEINKIKIIFFHATRSKW